MKLFRQIVIGVVCGVIGLYFIGFFDDKEVKSTYNKYKATTTIAETVAEPEFTVDAKTIIEDYKANEVRADEKYKDRLITVTGVVTKVAAVMNDTYVDVSFDKSEFYEVTCWVDDKYEISELADYDIGDEISVSGKCGGAGLGMPFLKKCVIN
jgi:DNA replicative helicase MCM subunit Mcm2 (Cdc46/Mcm family)